MLGIPTPRKGRPWLDLSLQRDAWVTSCTAALPRRDSSLLSSRSTYRGLQSEGDAAEGVDAPSPGDPEAAASRLRNGPLAATEAATEAAAPSKLVMRY
jgi:hypothetical protein